MRRYALGRVGVGVLLAWVLGASGQVPATRSAATAPARMAVPTEAQSKPARELIHQLFKDDYAKRAPADRAALATRLLKEAGETKDDPNARYVLLDEAAELAAGAGDPVTALEAIERQGEFVAMDVLATKAKLIVPSLDRIATDAMHAALAWDCLDLVDQAVAEDRFDLAVQLANVAEGEATKSRKVAVAAVILPKVGEFRLLAGERQRVQAALDGLAKTPDDAALNATVGRFYCLSLARWDQGLPYLARADDAALADAARKELAAPTEPVRQVDLGDLWWAIGEQASGRTKTAAQARAAFWYRRADAGLAGITRKRIEQRLQAAEGRSPTTNPATTTTASVLDLLALVDVQGDAISGEWRIANSALQCDKASRTRLQLPYHPAEEYDLGAAFKRVAGDGPIVLLLIGKDGPFGCELDAQGHTARIEMVGRKISEGNPTRVPCTLDNGRVYRVVVEVRKDRIAVQLDGKLLTEWKTDHKDLGRYAPWKLKDDKALGVGASNCEVIFEKIEVKEVSGPGRKVREK